MVASPMVRHAAETTPNTSEHHWHGWTPTF